MKSILEHGDVGVDLRFEVASINIDVPSLCKSLDGSNCSIGEFCRFV